MAMGGIYIELATNAVRIAIKRFPIPCELLLADAKDDIVTDGRTIYFERDGRWQV